MSFSELVCHVDVRDYSMINDSLLYLGIHLRFKTGELTNRLYDRRDDVNFPIVNFRFFNRTCGVFVSQLTSYIRASSRYGDTIVHIEAPA